MKNLIQNILFFGAAFVASNSLLIGCFLHTFKIHDFLFWACVGSFTISLTYLITRK